MSLPRYPAYKDSGVAWLGEVPGHWGVKPLWTLFRRTKRTGFIDEELLSVYRDYGVIPKASRDDNNNKPSEDLEPYQLVLPGDLAINKMKAWQGSVAISEYRGIVSPAYYVYEATHGESSRFLHYLMRSPRYITGYLSLSKGIRVNQWDLEPQYHSRMPVILPSAMEQQTIAAFLDRETGKIDALVAEQEKLVALLKEKRQAVISHAVTKGLPSTGSGQASAAKMKDSGIEWLGEVPEHWEVKRLKHVLRLLTEKTERRDNPIALENIEGWSGRFISTGTEFQGEGVAFECGDILFGKLRPYLAKVYLTESSGEAVGDFHVLRPSQKMDGHFVVYQMLNRDFITIVDSSTFGAKMPRVAWEFMSNMMLTVPPFGEQRAIASFLDTETTKFDALTTEANRAIELLQERRSALISAAVTGKIDVRSSLAELAP